MQQLNRVDYMKLNAKQKEIFNFQKVAALLADYGFNCIKLADDWQGADFLAYHKDGSETLKVQLKSRLTIGRKYTGKEVYMVFPVGDFWYLIKHDDLVEMIRKHTKWLDSESGKVLNYSSGAPNKKLVTALKKWRLGTT